jgi:hypothetical protein
MKALLTRALLTVACAIAAGCSNPVNLVTPGNKPPTAAPTVAPTIAPTATPTAAGAASIATSIPLGNGAAFNNAPLSTAVPAPAGYAQSLSVPLVNAAANTTVAITAGASPPAALTPLGIVRSAAGALRRAASPSSAFSPIFYNSIVPTNNITVAGNISVTQTFPSGTLVAGTQYYLAFFDTTQATPAWQTIAGPVTASGATLTFSGTVSSVTFVAGKLYGFATFSTTTPSATPPPAPQTLLYFGDQTALTIATEAGSVVNTLAIPSQTFDLDDAGNIYASDPHHGGPSPGMGGSELFAKFPAGTASASTVYTPSVASQFFASASGAGEVIAIHNVSQGVLTTDEWDPGAGGPPSRTITTSVPTGIISFVLTHDGSVYLPDRSATGVPQFDVFPPGSATASKVIPETIVPPAQYNNFSPNFSAVGADGTLYVTEYSFQQPDPNAGLYIYPVNGPERFIATASDANGAGPQGVDVDAANNIYVVNDNVAVTSPTTCQADSLHSVTVYNQAGTLLRTVTGSFSGIPITVAADGTAFVAAFLLQLQSACAVTGDNGIFAIAPGSTTANMISSSGSSEIVLFDGTHKTEPFSRSYHGAGTSGRGGFFQRRRFTTR